MPISDFTKLATSTPPTGPAKPSAFTELASRSVPPVQPRGLVRTMAPELIKKGVKAVGDYLAVEQEKDRNRTLGERFMSTFVEKPAKILNFASVDLPRYTLGGFSSIGKTVMEATLGTVVGKENVRKTFTPQTDQDRKINETFFKDENPVSYQQLKEQVDAFTAESEDATPWEKANLGATIAILGFAADAFPGKPSAGGLSKKLLRELAKDTDPVSVATTLKTSNVPEAIAVRAADRVAAAKTPTAVTKVLRETTQESIDEAAGIAKKPEPSIGTMYHGTKGNIDDIGKSDPLSYGDAQALYGPGTYLTDSKQIAQGYAKTKGTGASGRVLAGDLRDDLKFLDLDQPLPKSEKKNFEDSFNSSIGDLDVGTGKLPDGITGAEAIQMMRERLSESGATKDEAAEVLLSLQQTLGDSYGYDGFSHIGGKEKGSAHNVKILFDYGDAQKPIAGKFKNTYGIVEGDGPSVTNSPQAPGSSETLSAPSVIGKPRSTAGMTVRDQSGETVDPVQVERAFAGEYTAGDGVSRTFDEVAEDVMTTTAEPVLAARTIATMQSAKTKILEYVQNTEERIRKLQEDPSLRIDDESNPYQAMTLMPGRIGTQIEQVQDRLKTMFGDMNTTAKAGGRTLTDMRKDVNDFLWLRHAPERNASLGDGAAGITTKEAVERMDALKASPQYEDITRLGDEVAAMNKEALDTLLDSGVITRELYDTLTEKYQNYVPLNRIMENTSDIAGSLSGRGFDVKSTGVRRAKGSSREVADIVENTILNYEQAIIRAEKNTVDRATLQFVRDNEDALDNLMEIRRPRGLETTDDPNILQLFENGKRVWINIKDPSLAIAFRGIGREEISHIKALRYTAAFTRLMSGLATRFNPEFAFTNIIRDIQERTIFLSAQKGLSGKEAFKAAGRDPASLKAVTDFVLGRETPDAALYAEMKRLGGTTGGMGLSTRKKAELNLRHLEQVAQGGPRKYVEGVIEYLDNWNTVFEDATRLTTYKTALANGMTKRQAAAMAKEATVNFNRMGKGGPFINALYMFGNASIQGSIKTLRAMKNPKVLAGLTVIVGTAVTAVNEWNDSVDPEWRKKISKWDVVNSLPVVLPSDDGTFKTFNIPVAYGIKPMRVAADYAYQMANDENVTAVEATEGVLSAILEAYNPLGGTDMMSSATPTILDLPVEITRNQKWSGSSIKPSFDPYAPESTRYYDDLENKTSGKVAISLTQKLAGWGVEISPADMVYAFESYTGGAGRSAQRFAELGIRPITEGQLPPISDFPFISRFYKSKAEDEIFNTQAQSNLKELLTEDRRERFYIKKKAEDAWDSIAELPPDERRQKLLDMKAQDPELTKRVIDIAQAEKMGLVGEERQLKGATVAVRAQYIAAEMKSLATQEERKALLQNYKEKKILTEAVLAEIKALKAEQE